MTATYSLTTSIGEVRLYAGDTNIASTAFTDEEWQIFIDRAPSNNLKLAAAWGLRTLARDLARLGYWKEAGVSSDAAADMAVTLAIWLEEQAMSMDGISGVSFLGIPYAGGISRSDKTTVQSNTDRTTPLFTKNLHSVIGDIEESG